MHQLRALSISAWLSRRPKAFTLFELLVVVVVIAAVAGSVVLSVQGPLESARLEHAVEEFSFLDHQLRSHARRSGQGAALWVSADGSQLTVMRDSGRPEVEHRVLRGGVHVRQVLLPPEAESYGEIRFSADGQTSTYAVELADRSGQSRWLLFAGITGQQLIMNGQQEVERIFDALAQRSDAD